MNVLGVGLAHGEERNGFDPVDFPVADHPGREGRRVVGPGSRRFGYRYRAPDPEQPHGPTGREFADDTQ